MIENEINKENNPKSTWAKVLRGIGGVILTVLLIGGGVVGYAYGYNSEPFGSGDYYTEAIIMAIIGVFLGGIIGILVIALIMHSAEVGENTRITAENTLDKGVNTTSNADEIRKYKELLDNGIITLDEFNKKKSELLNK